MSHLRRLWLILLLAIDMLVVISLLAYGWRDLGLQEPTTMLCLICAAFVVRMWMIPNYEELTRA